MTYTLIIGAAPLAGHEDFYRLLLAEACNVVAADGAGEWCLGLGRTPDLVVGDFDSAHEGARERLAAAGASIEEHPTSKDFTDLELCVAAAMGRWDDPLCLTAAFTGRIDHTLAAVGLLSHAGKGARIAEPGWRAWSCTSASPLARTMRPGTQFSVVALSRCAGVTVRGARWSLDAAVLEPLSGRGVSNEALGGEVTVEVAQGTAVVIVEDSAD